MSGSKKKPGFWAEVRAEMRRAKEQKQAAGREPVGWQCARCATFNHGNPTHCGCGAHAGLAAIY